MEKTAIYYGFDDGQMLYALMSRVSGIRVWIEQLNGAFYAEWSVKASEVALATDEFCAGTWGDHKGLMASAMLATGWFEPTGREFTYPVWHINNDGVGEIWKLSALGAQWLAARDLTRQRPDKDEEKSMSPELKIKLQMVDAGQTALNDQRPLPPHTVASLREKLMLEWTYHSNAIEGNTLTLRETKVVLEGITVGGKSMREHFEATNHRDAILYVEDIVAKQEAVSEWQIKNIHSLVLKTIDNDEAGRYRRENVVISGASIIPPDFLHLSEEMRQLIDWHGRAAHKHPIERAAELHTRFVKVHPFIDGNGRTGRLLLNFELMKEGYPPAVIRKEDRLTYYDALDEACVSGNYDAITNLVAEAVQRSLDTYLGLLPHKGGKP